MSSREERWKLFDAAVAAAQREVFRTITGEDWRRALARARRTENSAAEAIRRPMEAKKLCGS